MNNPRPNLPLFSFGTLMDPDLLVLVSGQSLTDLQLQPAQLSGFAQREVQGDHFPVLVPVSGNRTNGRIIRGLTSVALQRILFFEGEEYTLSPISVTLNDGSEEPCVYFKDAAVYQVKESIWDFEHWVLQEKTEFIQRTRQYMSYFGKLSIAEADQYW